MLAVNLSIRLDVLALVSSYLTNKLISHEPLSCRKAGFPVPHFHLIGFPTRPHSVLAVVSNRYPQAQGELFMYY
jgi:hypothetical protein